jgi:hypothetical protein
MIKKKKSNQKNENQDWIKNEKNKMIRDEIEKKNKSRKG